MKSFNSFAALHQHAKPLLLANAWDIVSAKIFEEKGYAAIGTSSHAVAKARGYEDGEEIGFPALLSLAKQLVQSVNIPVTIDFEGGYSRSTAAIINHIRQLHDAGVAGINIEDSMTPAGRSLIPSADFQQTLSALAEAIVANNWKMFINVRTDTFLLGLPNALEETLIRAKAYEAAGANGIFVPCITQSSDIGEVVSATHLPLNVMCMPGLPGFSELQKLGVKRISMGSFFFNAAYDNIGRLASQILQEQNFSSIV